MRKQLCFLTLAMFAVAFAFVSCGGGGGNNNNGGGQTVSVTGVSLNKNTMALNAGSSETLTPTITPSNATNKDVTWTSSNDAIASVSGGRVTGVAQGAATITVRTNDGGHTATCSVTVNPATTTVPVTGVSLNKNTMTLTAGGTEQLTHTIQPPNATNQNVTWETSSSAVATVSNGIVTAIAQGSATITVRTVDGNHTATCAVTVNLAAVPVTGVSLNKNTMTLTAGGTEQLTHAIQPSNATNQNVTWETNNSVVATVNNGIVTAIAQGSATITVRTVDGNHTATCAVTVNPAVTTVPVTGVSLNKNTMTLTAGGTEQLTHTIQPSNATNQNVTWETSNSTVATVNNGLVTAVAPGSANITVRTVDGNHTATCAVTVNPATTTVPVTGVSLNKNTMTLAVGGTEQLTHAIQPSNATNQSVTWETNNSAVATVSNGLVTAVAQGSATITVRTADGGHTATCAVTVRTPGTPDTSWYYDNPTATTFTIYDVGQLAGLAVLVNNGTSNFSGKTIILGNNIDLSAYASGEGWTPIGVGYGDYYTFHGTFDGNGKTISNLTINRTSNSNYPYIGLFGSIYNGTLKNIGIVNASISGAGSSSSSGNIGGIAGRVSNNSSITNCYSTGAISGTGYAGGVGGIAGWVTNSSITNCYSTAAISGTGDVTDFGGIAGLVWASSITNCYSTGSVSGTGDGADGGIAGWVYDATITNCAALNASVTSSFGSIGRVAGYVFYPNVTLSNNIAWSGMLVNGSTVSGAANDQNGANKTGAEIHNGSAFNGMFTDSAWTKQTGYLPGLFGQLVPIPAHIAYAPIVAPPAPDTSWYNSASTTFTLNTAEQLAGLAELVNSGADTFSGKTIILGNNIDLSAYAGGEGWTPIGDYDGYRPFSGTFNGDYKTISNLAINRTTDYTGDYIGLFGYVSYGKIQNLGVVNASISGGNYIGGIAGYVYGADLMNCYSTGVISGTGNFVGGVAGYIYDSSAENCYSTAAISGNSYVGGIAGHAANSNIISCAALNVSLTGSGDSSYIGRIAGYANDSESVLSNNIAWSGMLVNGSTVSGTANDKNGADKTAAEIQSGNAFNGMFTDSVWTKQNGYLPGLFGQPVPIPAHIN